MTKAGVPLGRIPGTVFIGPTHVTSFWRPLNNGLIRITMHVVSLPVDDS